MGCAYCGRPTRRGVKACPEHRDVAAIDNAYQAGRLVTKPDRNVAWLHDAGTLLRQAISAAARAYDRVNELRFDESCKTDEHELLEYRTQLAQFNRETVELLERLDRLIERWPRD